MQEQADRNSILLAALSEIQKLQESDESAPTSDEMRILKSLAKDLQGDYSDGEAETTKTTQCWVGEPAVAADEEFDLLCLSELKLKARQLSKIEFNSNSSLHDSFSQLDQLFARQQKSTDNVAGARNSPIDRKTREEKIQELREIIRNSPLIVRAPPNIPPPKPPIAELPKYNESNENTSPVRGSNVPGCRSSLARPGPRPKKAVPQPLPLTNVPTITKISPKASPVEEEQPDEEFEALRSILPADFDITRLTRVFDKHFNGEDIEVDSTVNSAPTTTVSSPRTVTSGPSSTSSTPSSGSMISGMTATNTDEADEDTLTSNSDISPFSSIPNRSNKNKTMNTLARKNRITEAVGSWAGDKEPTREEKIAQVVNIWKKNRTTAPPSVEGAPNKEVKITEVVSAWLKGSEAANAKSASISKAHTTSSGKHHLKLFSSKDKKDKKDKEKEKRDKKEKKEKVKEEKKHSAGNSNHNSLNSSMFSSFTNAPIDSLKARWNQM
eukprot:TRINITY_DN300_c0_g1_i1.p1 TRINITY_DN300_c0_g1~~TRINITY_DN300_c0_g1_i1.p1  ORF type:complete len:497 (-),score=163.33 TRINITY_DN300_c0_g1_i1:119-1609(-)